MSAWQAGAVKSVIEKTEVIGSLAEWTADPALPMETGCTREGRK